MCTKGLGGGREAAASPVLLHGEGLEVGGRLVGIPQLAVRSNRGYVLPLLLAKDQDPPNLLTRACTGDGGRDSWLPAVPPPQGLRAGSAPLRVAPSGRTPLTAVTRPVTRWSARP